MESIDYGVCRLAVVPVRKESSDLTEQVTQLLFGDHYEVIRASKDKKWLHIKMAADQCEGWLDVNQHHTITSEYFDQINLADFKITIEVSSWILYKKNPLAIVMGSIVPISASELFKMEEQFAFNGESKALSQRRDFDFIKMIALRYLHAPHQWGGRSPYGIDAAAFSQLVFKIGGYSLPRFLSQQVLHGKKVDSLSQTKPGDIVFFQDKAGKIIHTGILLEEDKIIHVLGRVRIDHLLEEGILNQETKIFSHTLSSFRRII